MPRAGASVSAAAAAAAAAADKTPGGSVCRPRTRKQQQQEQQAQKQATQQDEPQSSQQKQKQPLQVVTPRLTPIERRLTRLSLRVAPSAAPPSSAMSPVSRQHLPSKQVSSLSGQQSPLHSSRRWTSTPLKRTSSSRCAAAASPSVQIGLGRRQQQQPAAAAVKATPVTRSRSAGGVSPCRVGEGVSHSSPKAEDAPSVWRPEDSEELCRLTLQSLRPSTAVYCGGRELYEKEVTSFVSKHVAARRGGLLYFCGASGVGKTCVARYALHRALSDPRVKEACSPQVLSLSCAHRERDVQLLEELLCRLLGKPTDDKAIRRELRDRLQLQGIVGAANKFTELSRKSQKLWLCLIDEVDFLVTKGQTRADMRSCGGSNSSSQQQQQQQQHDALLALALSATHAQSRIIVVAISNSTELGGHLSGLRIRTVIVCPYTEKEILAIINKRLEAAKQQLVDSKAAAGAGSLSPQSLPCLFAPAALLLFARKAANANGDIRMALSGLCRAVEEKLTEIQEELQAAPIPGTPEQSTAATRSPVSPLPRVKRTQQLQSEEQHHQGDEALREDSSLGPQGPLETQEQQDVSSPSAASWVRAAENASLMFCLSSPPPGKIARCSEGTPCVSSALRRKPPVLSALETELSTSEGPPTILSLSRSVAGSSDGLPTNSCPVTPGFVNEVSEVSAGTPQSLCSTAPSPAAAAVAAAATMSPILAKKQLRLLQSKTGDSKTSSSSSAESLETVANSDAPSIDGCAASAAVAATASAANTGSPLFEASLADEQQLVPCCTLESLPAGLLLQNLPQSDSASRTRRDSNCSSSVFSSSQQLRKGLGLRGHRGLGSCRRGTDGSPFAVPLHPCGSRRSVCSVAGEDTPSAAGGVASSTALSKRASDTIGVGVMSAKASTVYGHDQQQVVSRIQGLPLMQRVYLLAACRTAQKKLLERAAASAGTADKRRHSTATSSQESRHSQSENAAPSNRATDPGGVQISLEEVEAQYELLADELPHGYLLNGKMRSSCWRYAVESFEQMGLMVAARPSAGGSLGAPGGGGLQGTGARLSRRPRPSLGSFGFGGRKSAGSFNSLFSASQTKTQAWELQLSPALVEAAIKRLQPQLMGSDIEEHFSRGLEA